MEKMHRKHVCDGMHFRLVGGSRGNEKRVQFNGERNENTREEKSTLKRHIYEAS